MSGIFSQTASPPSGQPLATWGRPSLAHGGLECCMFCVSVGGAGWAGAERAVGARRDDADGRAVALRREEAGAVGVLREHHPFGAR